MSVQFRCNRDSCGTIESPHNAYENPDGWFLVRDDGDNDYHFCSKDCLMFWAAESKPIEDVSPFGQKIAEWQQQDGPHINLYRPYDDEDGTV